MDRPVCLLYESTPLGKQGVVIPQRGYYMRISNVFKDLIVVAEIHMINFARLPVRPKGGADRLIPVWAEQNGLWVLKTYVDFPLIIEIKEL